MNAPRFNPIILLPTYNNASKITPVLEAVAAMGRPMLIVNDGATDDTSAVLDAFVQKHPGAAVTRVDHARNRGKGQALLTGFDKAEELGFTHALTIDTDGQHDPADAAALLAAAEANPTALVTGCRSASDPDYPTINMLGRLYSNLCIFITSGRRVEDSQCGYRVYPLGLVQTVKCRAGRYGYEAEILTRSGWAGCDFVQVPIRVIYPQGDQRISHFRPFRDSAHAWFLHMRLAGRAIWPWPFVKWPPETFPETSGETASGGSHETLASSKTGAENDLETASTKALSDGDLQTKTQANPSAATKPSFWKRTLRWFDPRELVRTARRDRVSQMSVAAGLGVGVFVANLPVYPVQTLVAIYLAKRLHVHPVSTVLGSQLSFPPIGLGLIFAAIYLGHFVLTGEAPAWSDFQSLGSLSFADFRHLMHEYFLSWWIGGVTIGWCLGWATFLLAVAVMRFVPVESDTMISEQTLRGQD